MPVQARTSKVEVRKSVSDYNDLIENQCLELQKLTSTKVNL